MTAGSFNGKVALVTGAAAGIGRATALAFARAGARVIVADIDATVGEETAAQIKAANGEAAFVRADVSRSDDIKALVRRTIDLYGRLDCAHNNAGTEGARARIAALREEDWARTIAINLTGVWLCMKFEIQQMAKQGGGAIVNTASTAGHVGFARHCAYAASKHGVIGLTKTAALEYMKLGIRVNAVSPGLISTAMIDRGIDRAGDTSNQLFQRVRRQIIRRSLSMQQPAKRMGSPEEVAEAVVWLCSESASYVNGHTLVVDGGMIAE
jgi:NAD(P)-dependent dehydrogenase (short-subunit alcohol dehydrogenase family)